MTHDTRRSAKGAVAASAGLDLEQLPSSCEAAVAALAMTVPFNHVAFTTALADSRGRPIHLHPHHSPHAVCGSPFHHPYRRLLHREVMFC